MLDPSNDEIEQIGRELKRIFGDDPEPSPHVGLPLRDFAEFLDFLRGVPSGVSADELLRLASEYRRAHLQEILDCDEEARAVRAENDRLLALLERDIASTIGEEYRHWVGDSAQNAREYTDADTADLVQRIVDEVQQDFMDTFVDVTWPSCPRHPNHPLWFHDGAWHCDRDRERLADLGGLDAIGAGASGREARRAREEEPRPFTRRRKKE